MKTKKRMIMPYTYENYPNTMKNLTPEVRKKAIDILNKLIEDRDMDGGMAIATSISKAREWAAKTRKGNYSGKGKKAVEIYVKAHKKGWAVEKQNADKASFVFKTKEEAIHKAREIASREEQTLIIYKEDGTIQEEKIY